MCYVILVDTPVNLPCDAGYCALLFIYYYCGDLVVFMLRAGGSFSGVHNCTCVPSGMFLIRE
jgi:hypothetical protein